MGRLKINYFNQNINITLHNDLENHKYNIGKSQI